MYQMSVRVGTILFTSNTRKVESVFEKKDKLNVLTNITFECEHHVPVIVYKILKDLLYFNILNKEYQKTLRILDTTPSYQTASYEINKNISEHLVVFTNTYELSEVKGKNGFNILINSSNIYKLERDIIDFLFCFNHKRYRIDTEKINMTDFSNILKKHHREKSIFISLKRKR